MQNHSSKSKKTFFEKFKNDEEFERLCEEADLWLDVAIKIAKAREEQQISQKQLAEMVGTNQSVISRIETGQENFSIKKLFKIAVALNKKVELKLT